MRIILLLVLLMVFSSCKDKKPEMLSPQAIVDEAIEVSGGDLYETSNVSFVFRDRTYVLEQDGKNRILKRITTTDSAMVMDVRSAKGLQRFVNDSLVSLPDSLTHKYANSINSVHYFAYLPFGLNDPAVNKKLLGETMIKERDYYKVQVTFDRQNGGDDFEDVYIYWFNKETLKPDYLAYEFHVDGGGMRFREALNERYLEGIRFVDYNNYKPRTETKIQDIDQLYIADGLELLSKIELTDITVNRDNYN